MSQPTMDEIVSMSESDFANFAASFDLQTDEGHIIPKEAEVEADKTDESTEEVDTDEIDQTSDLEEDDEEPNQDEEELDAESFYSALTAPIKAAGKEFSFTDPEEIRTLMQKGIGYEKRMGQLNKFQRHMEALDKAELLNDSTLNLIIDLAHGKPEALRQYIDKNKIDVYDIIGIDSESYTPEKHVATEEEYAQSQVVQEIKSLDGYENIQPIVENDWDEESRNKVLADPQLATYLIDAAKAGIHDMVLKEAEKVKLLASEPLSDLAAYVEAGNKLHKQGAFDKMSKKKTSNVDETIQPTNVSSHNKRSSKRKKGVASVKDIASMSVEELQKFAVENNL